MAAHEQEGPYNRDEKEGSGTDDIKEVELKGGPPWGFRTGALTTAIVPSTNSRLPSQEEEEESHWRAVGAVKITRVNPESKASSAGLRSGDLIISVNGEEIPTSEPTSSSQTHNSVTSSSSPSEQHHKISSQLQGDKISLSILSKKSKKSNVKKLQNTSSRNEQENVTSKPPASSVRWADTDGPNNTQTNIIDNTNYTTKKEKQTETEYVIEDKKINNLEKGNNLSLLGQDIPHTQLASWKSQPPSSPSHNLLSDIIDELQLAAANTANFLSEMEAHLQEEITAMEEPQGLLRQVSNASSIPPGTPPPPPLPPFMKLPLPFNSSSLLIKQEDLQQIKSDSDANNEVPLQPVWSPPGVPPSPKLGKKFRPVTFSASASSPIVNGANSSVPSSPIIQNGTALQSPGGFLSPPSEPSSISNSFDNSKYNNYSSSTTTSSNLPKYQSPTVVLLQKAREGQFSKGAAYLVEQKQPQPDTRISNLGQQNEPVIISYSENYRPPPSQNRNKPAYKPPSQLINIPMTSKSTLSGEKEQRDWYKRMYESLHVERKPVRNSKCTYPAGRIKQDQTVKSFWAKRVHSNGTVSEPEDYDHPEEEEFDFNRFGSKTVSSPVSAGGGRAAPPPGIRFNPGRIEDYNPASGSVTSVARKQRYHRQMQPDLKKHWALASPTKSSGYDSDSNYIIRKRTETDSSFGPKSPEPSPLSPAEQKHLYAEIYKGGEVPLQGLKKYVPGPGPRDISYEDPGDGFRTVSPSQNIRYSESTVNIHYRAPVRIEEKEYVSEELLRKRQQLAMKQFYEEQRKLKYTKELEDMERRRHSDNFSSHKSPIPLNRYEDDVIDGLIDNTPPRPGSGGLWQRMTPEPMTPSSAKSGPPLGIARALFNFNAQSPRELQLVKGDLVLIRRKIDVNWYEGELNPGKSSYFYPNGSGGTLGIFPCSYVEILPDSCRTSPAKYSTHSSRPFEHEGLARAIYNFRPSHSFELELLKGELVILSKRVDKNWYEGRKQKKPSLAGIFPVSYVDVIQEVGSSSRLGSKSPLMKKPIGQPVSHSLSYGSDMDDFSLKKHHYKPNEFILQDDSDYGEVFSPNPTTLNKMANDRERNARNRRRMNQRLELITIDTRLNNDQPFRYRSIFNYKPVHQDELELREGDIIEVLEKCDDGWFVGTSTRTGLFGTFPGNYVERI